MEEINTENMDIRELILYIIEERQGCKSTELASDKRIALHPNSDLFLGELKKLIDDCTLREVEYSLPSMPYRAKSFLLPGESEIRIT